MDNKRLKEHVASTYRNLRFGLAGIGLVFPVFLGLIGWVWYGIPLQGSLSAYYFAPAPVEGGFIRRWLTSIDFAPISELLSVLTQLDGDAPMRIWFVGVLFVLGFLLYLYKGFTLLENKWLNAAGVFVVLIALFPMEWECVEACHSLTVHGTAAVLGFFCIGVVAIWCAQDSLYDLPERGQGPNDYVVPDNWLARLLVRPTIWIIDVLARVMLPVVKWVRARIGLKEMFPNHPTRQRYRNRYYVTSILMFIFPFVAFVFTLLTNSQNRLIFAVELLGLWSFAAYWIIKSLELEESQAEVHAIAEVSAIPAGVAQQAGDSPTQDQGLHPETVR